jgi:hypothetical protein
MSVLNVMDPPTGPDPRSAVSSILERTTSLSAVCQANPISVLIDHKKVSLYRQVPLEIVLIKSQIFRLISRIAKAQR